MELQIKIEEDLNTAQQLLKEGNYTDAIELLNKCNWLSHENSSEFKKYNKEELDILILKIFSELDKAKEMERETNQKIILLKREEEQKAELIRIDKQKNDIKEKLSKIKQLLDKDDYGKALKELHKLPALNLEEKFPNLSKEIDKLIIQAQSIEKNYILKNIKNTILNLATKYSRLQINEIAEKCEFISEDLIIEVVLDMINNNEIYAEYFSSNRAVVFNQTANIKEIDSLMEKFKISEEKKEDLEKPFLSIIREFDFVGGQIRFKIGLKNNTNFSFTNLKITFNIPDALKWILHEPSYSRVGDSILIPKLGANEKKAISFYLEPINCMESPVNATVSFFDERDKPHAATMKPKMVSITCPIFFTEADANLARVKSLRRKLSHHDKKLFPLVKTEESVSIFSSILSVLKEFDIKLTFSDFSEEDRFGEAWFYGITKVKKNQIVIYILLDGTDKKVEIEVSGNEESQITAFLAEIGDRTRKKLILNKIIDIEDDFYDMRVSILSKLCPFCYTSISDNQVQKFIDGGFIQCKNCNVELKINENLNSLN